MQKLKLFTPMLLAGLVLISQRLVAAAKAALKPDKNLMAVRCHQTKGGQGIDVGIAEVIEK